jgi:predicted RNA-binding Zn-ribbon protein involved in translation (DUF1610 family)
MSNLERRLRKRWASLDPESDHNYITCPRCGEQTLHADKPLLNAISRTDNETYICSRCGEAEAAEDFAPGKKIQGQHRWKAADAILMTIHNVKY